MLALKLHLKCLFGTHTMIAMQLLQILLSLVGGGLQLSSNITEPQHFAEQVQIVIGDRDLNRTDRFMKRFWCKLKFIKIMNLLKVRYGFGNFREMVSKYRIKSRQNRVNFVNYWNRQRERISDIRQRRMPKPVYLWCIILSLGFLFYSRKYGNQR